MQWLCQPRWFELHRGWNTTQFFWGIRIRYLGFLLTNQYGMSGVLITQIYSRNLKDAYEELSDCGRNTPLKITWNTIVKIWKMIFLFKWVIFRFMLIFQGVFARSQVFESHVIQICLANQGPKASHIVVVQNAATATCSSASVWRHNMNFLLGLISFGIFYFLLFCWYCKSYHIIMVQWKMGPDPQ